MSSMKMIKDVIRRRLASAGYEIVPKWMADEIPLRDHLRRLFARYDVSCVIDVGANVGQYGTFLRRSVGYSGEIISFEPASATFARLLEVTKRDPNWRARRLALGSERTKMTMNILGSSALNSFLEPDQAAFQQTGLQNQIRNARVVDTEQVEVDTLENLLTEVGSRNVYLKMDTQGYDRQVLEGGRKCVDRFVGLQTEVAIQKLYQGATDYRDMTQFVTSLGFEISGFFPLDLDAYLRIIECDVVFVRSNRAR